MKKIYLKIKFFVFLILSLFVFDKNIFSKEVFFKKTENSHSEVLKNVSTYSDNDLYKLAKRINEDALPGKSDYAQILLTEAIRKNPKNVDALIEIASLIDQQPLPPFVKVQKKFNFIYQAFLIEPNNPKVRFRFASVLLQLEQKDLFQQIYSQTLQNFPNHPDTIIEQIQIFSKVNPQKAVELSDQVFKQGINIGDFLQDFLIALKASDNENNFSKNLLVYAEQYPNRWLWYHLGLQYIKENKYNNAEYAFEKSIALGNAITGRLQLGILQYRNQNKIKDGIKNLKIVIDSMKSDPFISTNFIYFAHIQLTCALMLSNDFNATMKELNFVSKYTSQNHEHFIELMNYFLDHGHADMLVEPIQTVMLNDPMFAEPYHVLSRINKNQKQNKENVMQGLDEKFKIFEIK